MLRSNGLPRPGGSSTSLPSPSAFQQLLYPRNRLIYPIGFFVMLLIMFFTWSSSGRSSDIGAMALGKWEARGGKFPQWYGNSDKVGKSPWDFVPAKALDKRKTRVLFLTDYNDYLSRMDTIIYETVDAALRHPGLAIDVYGPHWQGWNPQKKISENLDERWGCGYWDLVITFAWLLNKDDPLMDAPGCGTVFLHQLGDCHDGTPTGSCMQDWFPYQSNITIARYAFELSEVFTYDRIMHHYPGMRMHLFGHSPDGANQWNFYPLQNFKDKKKDAVVFGYDGTFYPLRTKVTWAIHSGQTFIERHPHPGYDITPPASLPPAKTYQPNSPLYTNHIRTREDFARGMREAKICVFDSSLERKMIRKYAQAMLSGCVIAGDLPTEMEETLRPFVIELKPYWTIEEINNAIKTALADPKELQRKAFEGFIYARKHLTNLKKMDDFLHFYQDYLRGERGYKFPYGFSMRCRAYWGNEGGFRPPWCGDQYLGLEGPEEYQWRNPI